MPEPCTFRVRFGAERNSNFQNASMSLSTFLRFLYAPHTIFRVLFQRPWINFSSNDICFFLPYTVEKQRTKKKCVAFATRADTLYLIISFGFDFTCSLPSRFSVFFFISCSFECCWRFFLSFDLQFGYECDVQWRRWFILLKWHACSVHSIKCTSVHNVFLLFLR